MKNIYRKLYIADSSFLRMTKVRICLVCTSVFDNIYRQNTYYFLFFLAKYTLFCTIYTLSTIINSSIRKLQVYSNILFVIIVLYN
jgi:hypothetical protein